MRVFLTGFMGSGKSFLGRRLSSVHGLPFIDLDAFVEQKEGMAITRIFEEFGEAHFRALETDVLHSFKALPMFIMATGGGTPCFHDNMAWMNDHGTTVFIDPTTEIIAGRLKNERAKRPLLNAKVDLLTLVEQKLNERRSCYQKAQYHVRQTNPKQDLVRLISNHLQSLDASYRYE